MLDNTFCEFLEFELTKALKNSDNQTIKHFWCDGILLPTFESQYSKKFVNDNKQVVMTAFLGATGQDEYELTLKFGNKALSRYARDLNILECIPNIETDNWFRIDIEKQNIEIQLI